MRLQGIALVYGKKEKKEREKNLQLGSTGKGRDVGKCEGRGEGQNDIKSFGRGRVVVKRDEDNTGGGISYMSRRGEEGGLASLMGICSMMMGMIMGTLPRRRGSLLGKKISHREREKGNIL